MTVSYDVFVGAFLSKITEYEFVQLEEETQMEIVLGYMKRALTHFNRICEYDFIGTADDTTQTFNVDVNEEDVDELAEIISEGMVVQWLKPYYYKQELLENAMSTKDFSTYSPAELCRRVGSAYMQARKDYTHMIREYSFDHGDLTELHI